MALDISQIKNLIGGVTGLDDTLLQIAIDAENAYLDAEFPSIVDSPERDLVLASLVSTFMKTRSIDPIARSSIASILNEGPILSSVPDDD